MTDFEQALPWRSPSLTEKNSIFHIKYKGGNGKYLFIADIIFGGYWRNSGHVHALFLSYIYSMSLGQTTINECMSFSFPFQNK